MKIAVRINDARQFSPDDWESTTHIKEIPESTTIGELIEWQKEVFPHNKKVQSNEVIEQMHISNME